jgi:hypothetical protein
VQLDVEQRGARHALGMIQCEAERDARTAVMADDRETLVSQGSHELDELACHLALRIALASRAAGRRP